MVMEWSELAQQEIWREHDEREAYKWVLVVPIYKTLF